jgi:hypothetical protein
MSSYNTPCPEAVKHPPTHHQIFASFILSPVLHWQQWPAVRAALNTAPGPLLIEIQTSRNSPPHKLSPRVLCLCLPPGPQLAFGVMQRGCAYQPPEALDSLYSTEITPR